MAGRVQPADVSSIRRDGVRFRAGTRKSATIPSRKGLEYRSVTVEFVIIAEVIGLPADERTRLAVPLDPLRSLIKDTVPGADSTDFIHRGLQRGRP